MTTPNDSEECSVPPAVAEGLRGMLRLLPHLSEADINTILLRIGQPELVPANSGDCCAGTAQQDEPPVSLQEAAAYLGVSRWTVWRRLEDPEECERMGLIRSPGRPRFDLRRLRAYRSSTGSPRRIRN